MLRSTFVWAILAAAPTIVARSVPKEERATSCDNTPTSRNCWGEFDINTDYYQTTPETGVTREYWLSAEKATIAPDGYQVDALIFNGTMPGPTIEADWGDEIVVHVTNNLPDNGTAIHWHGIRQLNTNPADGVPGVTQCPMAPGETTTYRFRATQYGTSWYHSHFSLQLATGLFGPIVIHGPASANYDVDVGTIMIQDFFHRSVWEIWETTQRVLALQQPVAENGLINGLNPYDCSNSDDAACVGGTTERFETTFTKGKRYLFRVIGVQTDGYMKFAIDHHKLLVIAADFVPIVPYEADAVILSSGQRYNVVVTANQDEDAYWLRAIYQTACNQNDNDNKDNILGIVRYSGVTDDTEPTTTVNSDITDSCGDEPYDRLVPFVPHTVGASSTKEQIDLQWYYELDTVFHWTLHQHTLIVNWSAPTLLDVYHHTTSLPVDSNIYAIDTAGQPEWVYWIIQDATAVDAFHPMHLHGHDFYLLAQGRGAFVPGLVALNMDNPPRRDTATLAGNGYTVIAFQTDNPGSWLLHCHIAWHASQGLAMQLLENESAIPAQMEGIVDEMQDTCSVWQDWYNGPNGEEQDDSGI